MSQDMPGTDSEDDLNPAVGQQIYDNLRLVYLECLKDGIPDTMKALINRLDEQTSRIEQRAKSKGAPGGPGSRRVSDRPSAPSV